MHRTERTLTLVVSASAAQAPCVLMAVRFSIVQATTHSAVEG